MTLFFIEMYKGLVDWYYLEDTSRLNKAIFNLKKGFVYVFTLGKVIIR